MLESRCQVQISQDGSNCIVYDHAEPFGPPMCRCVLKVCVDLC